MTAGRIRARTVSSPDIALFVCKRTHVSVHATFDQQWSILSTVKKILSTAGSKQIFGKCEACKKDQTSHKNSTESRLKSEYCNNYCNTVFFFGTAQYVRTEVVTYWLLSTELATSKMNE